jgi:hypothetical protein
MFRPAIFASLLLPALAVPALPQSAPGDTSVTRVQFPREFATGFRLYDRVDKPERKIVRYLYINPQALAAVKPGEPFPDGTVLVMEDHDVALEAGGSPLRNAEGRLVPTLRVKAVAVMEKRAGWGDTNPFPIEKDNGDWEYASFKPDGTLNPIKLDNCHSCHLPQKGLDYTFSGAKIHEAARR